MQDRSGTTSIELGGKWWFRQLSSEVVISPGGKKLFL